MRICFVDMCSVEGCSAQAIAKGFCKRCYAREDARRRRAEGLCAQSGCREASAPGRTLCGHHLAKRRPVANARAAKHARESKAAGTRCTSNGCRRPPEPGKTRCVKHLTASRDASRERLARLKAAGLCTWCGESPSNGRRYCDACRSRALVAQKNERSARAAAGMCPRCGNRPPANGGKVCEQCSAMHRRNMNNRFKRLRDAGRCSSCGAEATAGGLCHRCWLRDKARAHLGSGAHEAVEALQAAWDKQNGRCRYTGEALVPGENASVDHAIPTSRGGARSADNIEWTTLRINRMKSDMTPEEFVALIRLIASRFSRPQ